MYGLDDMSNDDMSREASDAHFSNMLDIVVTLDVLKDVKSRDVSDEHP